MRHLLLLFAAFVGPIGCLFSSALDDAWPSTPPTTTPTPTPTARHYEPPPGCKRTACDVEAEQCRANAQASCIKCKVDCGAIQIEYQSQCIASCARLCSITDQEAKRCDDGAKSCRASSPRNAFCADGLADACVPLRSSASQLPNTSSSQRSACTGAEAAGFVDACFSATATTSACQAFISAHRSCRACALGSTGAEPLWTPANGEWAWINQGLCVAVRGDIDCGRAVFAAETCAKKACDACENPDACIKAANDLSCAEVVAAKEACVKKLSSAVRASCILETDSRTDFGILAKEMINLVCGS